MNTREKVRNSHISVIETASFIAVIILIIMWCPVVCCSSFADTGTYEDTETGISFTYETAKIYNVEGILITGFAEGSMLPEDGTMTVPGSIDGQNVVGIGPRAFISNSDIKSLVLPDTICYIQGSAFCACRNLKNVIFSQNLRILESGVFSDCGLTRLDLPDSLEKIGTNCFYNINSLTEVSLPEKVTEIPYGTFAVCRNITSFTIGKNVTSIDGTAFDQCDNFREINVEFGNEVYESVDGVLYTKENKTLIIYPRNKAGAEYTVQNGTIRIGASAFHAARNLEKVVLPESVKTIGNLSFGDCYNLVEINMNYGLQTIDNLAFFNSMNLSSADIPETVSTIGESVFVNCAITHVTIPKDIKELNESTFNGCNNLTEVILNDVLVKIDSYAFMACRNLAEIYIPESVTVIEPMVFETAGASLPEGQKFTIKGAAGSAAEEYALQNSIEFVISDPPLPYVKPDQPISLPTRSIKRAVGSKPYSIRAKAVTPMTYMSGNTKIATVTEYGLITVKRPGKIKIYITAAENEEYKETTKSITLTVTPAKPSISLKNIKKRQVKITWSKVRYATGYQLYVKAPGSKKFRKRVTRNAKVKSVTHMGLKKGKTYKYKVRVFSVVNGKTIYGSFSRIKSIKIKR